MPGLVLKLAPSERLLLNGAVIENGDRRSRLSILTPGAHLLRLRDAIPPHEARTPVTRLCYALQLVISGDQPSDPARAEILSAIRALSAIFTDLGSVEQLEATCRAVSEGAYYRALRSLRPMIEREKILFSMSAA